MNKRRKSGAMWGSDNPMYGKHHSEETRRKISIANRGKKRPPGWHFSEEAIMKLRLAHLGKKASDETKRKIGEASKRRITSDETRRRLSGANRGENNPRYGVHLSEETKRKISEANRGRKHTEETRNKMSLALAGRKWSEETRKKHEKLWLERAIAAGRIIIVNGEMQRKPRYAKKDRQRRSGKYVPCATCGKIIWRYTSSLKNAKTYYCSDICKGKAAIVGLNEYWVKRTGQPYPGTGKKGNLCPSWKGGVTYTHRQGNYKPVRHVRCPNEYLPMARKDHYVMEHRLVVARAIGRCLLRSEVVHHINHDPQDNRLENLALFSSNREHRCYEAKGKPEPIWRGSANANQLSMAS